MCALWSSTIAKPEPDLSMIVSLFLLEMRQSRTKSISRVVRQSTYCILRKRRSYWKSQWKYVSSLVDNLISLASLEFRRVSCLKKCFWFFSLLGSFDSIPLLSVNSQSFHLTRLNSSLTPTQNQFFRNVSRGAETILTCAHRTVSPIVISRKE